MRNLQIHDLGLQNYADTLTAMQQFTNQRDANTPDEIWLLEHPPVFTQGQAGKAEHIINPGNIPVIQTDRGGQVTYHGPGQLVIYVLLNLTRLGLGTRNLVINLEQIIIDVLAEFQIKAVAKREAPGIYINDAKICSIGLRVRRGFSYHGLAFNLNMDLEPFTRINPCGIQGLRMTQLSDFITFIDSEIVKAKLINQFKKQLLQIN